MDVPTAAEIRTRSPLLTARHPDTDPGEGDSLQPRVNVAASLVAYLACRIVGPYNPEGRAIPTALEEIARHAVTLKTERVAEAAQARTRRSAVGRAAAGGLRSISAGSWSESYFGPADAREARVLDPDPELHEALWTLADAECREAWIDTWEGRDRPGVAVQTFAWRERRSPRRGGY